MKIIINGVTYPRAKRGKGAQSVSYLAEGLPEGLTAAGTVATYRDDGFLLCEDTVSDYARQESKAGLLRLTNVPEPEPVEATEEAETEEPVAEVTQLDRVEAQATYTAMMTDTLLPEEDEE